MPKKNSVKKSAAKKAPSFKFSRVAKPRTKGDIFGSIASNTGLSRKQVTWVFDCLQGLINTDLKRGGPEVFALPGLAKIIVKKMPAKPARQGVNPFTGQTQMFKAKPARSVVKIRPLKALKSMV